MSHCCQNPTEDGGRHGHGGGHQGHGDGHQNHWDQPPTKETLHFLITGVKSGCYSRLEIYDFVENEKMFSLYIQALNAMFTNFAPDDVQSFYQIGGIHGRPYEEWDGAKNSDNAGKFKGYCTHGTVLFPTWHRPYVLLYEQVLQKRAEEIAATYTIDRSAWQEAAKAIRQPYWDWASHATPPPEVLSLARVTITDSQGKKVTVDNPLFSYTFPSVARGDFAGNFQSWPNTLRRPVSAAVDTASNVQELTHILEKDGPNIQASTYAMLTRVSDWDTFSNVKAGENPGTSTSLEGIHNGIHFRVGASHVQGLFGHMGDNDVAAFDPIFFLHHSNVDRMISLWSALHPGVWVSPGDSSDGTAVIPEHTTVDTNTSLSPFWKSNTTFWTSAETQDIHSTGYSYPEFDGLDMGNPQAVKMAIARKVNSLYGSSGEAGKMPKSPSAPAPSPKPTDGCPNHGGWDWTARIEVKKYDIGCSFQVILFLGEVPANPKEWALCPTSIGSYQILVNENRTDCANCASQTDLVEHGFVPLNHGIKQHSGLRSLDPAGVVKYLTDNLHWKVQKIDGTPADASSLEVTIFSIPLEYPSGAMFPVAGKRNEHGACTHGRRGGCRRT